MILKSTLIGATAIAIALTSFDLRPAAAAPEGGAAIAKQKVGADELSAQRKRRRQGVHPGVPLAAFGAIVGTIGAVAAAKAVATLRAQHNARAIRSQRTDITVVVRARLAARALILPAGDPCISAIQRSGRVYSVTGAGRPARLSLPN